MDIDAQLLDRYVRTQDADAFSPTGAAARGHGLLPSPGASRVIITMPRKSHRVASWNWRAKLGSFTARWRVGCTRPRLTGLPISTAKPRCACRRHELARRPARFPYADAGWAEIAPLIDAALAELPEESRLAVVLYYLEGRSQAEVAAELAINQSATVSRRGGGGCGGACGRS